MDNIKLHGLSVEETYQIIPKHTVLLGYMGSIAHGTWVPKTDPNCIDDKDVLGVCVGPRTCYMGFNDGFLRGKDNRPNSEQQEVQEGEWDVVVYEIRKFFNLLMKQNPNVLGLLWLQEKDYIHISESGRLLLDNRDIFVSKAAYTSYIRYSHGQIHRMTHGAFEGYMGKKRKELVERFRYDTKNASHCIRLLRSCIEFLTDGKLRVFRHDAPELKEIKTGQWSLERVKAEADRLFVLAQEAYVRSSLPPEPDKARAEELLMRIMERELAT